MASKTRTKTGKKPAGPAPRPAAEAPQFEPTTSRRFPEWLAGRQASLALTTCQAGKLFPIGFQTDEIRRVISVGEA